MSDREPVTADDLERSVALVAEGLRNAAGLDWSVPAGALEWTCRRTADHLAGCLVAYAGLLAVRPRDRWINFDAAAGDDAGPPDLLEFILAAGRILAAMVRTCPPDALAYHPYGTSDPEGFAAMGCVETLVHGYDLAAGLNLTIDPPADLCARVLGRMFPNLAAAGEQGGPWRALLHATGRESLPGQPPVTTWRWHGAPLPG